MRGVSFSTATNAGTMAREVHRSTHGLESEDACRFAKECLVTLISTARARTVSFLGRVVSIDHCVVLRVSNRRAKELASLMPVSWNHSRMAPVESRPLHDP